MVGFPARCYPMALGVAILAAVPACLEAQQPPQSITTTMQARVTIVPSIEAPLATSPATPAVAALITDFLDSPSLTRGAPAAETRVLVSRTRTSPTGPTSVGAESSGPPTPPILHTLEWAEGREAERLMRYVVAVVS